MFIGKIIERKDWNEYQNAYTANKKRPQMFVGDIDELSLIILSSFIRGFFYSNINADRVDTIDSAFMYEFHTWIKNKLEKSQNINLENGRNYIFYLSKVYNEPREQIDAFFDFCEKFFEEVEKGNIEQGLNLSGK